LRASDDGLRPLEAEPTPRRNRPTWPVAPADLAVAPDMAGRTGKQPNAVLSSSDAGRGLRAGQTLAMTEVPCRGDVFHALQSVQPLVTFLENRAYDAIATRADLERKTARRRWRGQCTHDLAGRMGRARRAENEAIALATDVAVLADWLRYDILSVHPAEAYLTA
jgi:hypothetical protein